MNKLKALIKEMYPEDRSQVQLGISFGVLGKKDGYRTTQIIVHGLVFYASFFFEYAWKEAFTGTPCNKLGVQIYYGLGSESGPASKIKRHKYFRIFNRKVK